MTDDYQRQQKQWAAAKDIAQAAQAAQIGQCNVTGMPSIERENASLRAERNELELKNYALFRENAALRTLLREYWDREKGERT